MRAEPTDKRTKYGTVILSDGTLDYSFKGRVALNRSQHWKYANTYHKARDKSPSNEPVR